MGRRWFKWLIRIGVALLAILAAGFAALSIHSPDAARMLRAFLIHQFIGNKRPPAIAEDELVGANFQNQAEVGRKLTEALQHMFPSGTSEATLKSALLNQRFKPPPPPPADCVPPGQEMPVGRTFTFCPKYDPTKMLEYRWGDGIVCGEAIIVRWATDDRHDITQVNAVYYQACL